jgi:hypothetical protein
VDDNQRKLIAKITSTKDKYFIEVGGRNKLPVDDLSCVVALSKQIVEITKGYLAE